MMRHEDDSRRASASGRAGGRPEPRHPGESREPRAPTDPLVLSTTDPAVAAEAEHQSDWMRHPFATIRLETTQAGKPELMAVTSPWTADPGPSRRAPTAVSPIQAPVQPPPEVAEPARGLDRNPETHAGSSRVLSPPWWPPAGPTKHAPLTRHLWIAAIAGLLGGLIGSMGYLYLSGSRRHEASRAP